MCINYNKYGGMNNHKLKCKHYGRFMSYKGITKTFDSECGIAAQVSNADSEYQLFWSR